nr:hypothetical protein [Paenibacillus sp. NEAU-GSW1]
MKWLPDASSGTSRQTGCIYQGFHEAWNFARTRQNKVLALYGDEEESKRLDSPAAKGLHGKRVQFHDAGVRQYGSLLSPD